MRLLADTEHCKKATLKPAVLRWQTQYGASRPLEVKLASKKTLHDRLIFVDDERVFTLGQSLNAIAARAPTSIVRVDAATAEIKVEAYANLWMTATPI
jgi:hypothetical protein